MKLNLRNGLAAIFLLAAFLVIPWLPAMAGTDLPTIFFLPALLALHLFLRQTSTAQDGNSDIHFFLSELPWLWIFLFSLTVPVLTAGSTSLDQIAQYQSGAFSQWLAFSDPLNLLALLISMAAMARLLSAIQNQSENGPEIQKRKQLGILVYFFLLSALQVVVWLGAGFIPMIFAAYVPQARIIWILVLISKTLVWMGFQLTLWQWRLVWDKLATLTPWSAALGAVILLVSEVVYAILTNYASLTGFIYWMQIILAIIGTGVGLAAVMLAFLLGRKSHISGKPDAP